MLSFRWTGDGQGGPAVPSVVCGPYCCTCRRVWQRFVRAGDSRICCVLKVLVRAHRVHHWPDVEVLTPATPRALETGAHPRSHVPVTGPEVSSVSAEAGRCRDEVACRGRDVEERGGSRGGHSGRSALAGGLDGQSVAAGHGHSASETRRSGPSQPRANRGSQTNPRGRQDETSQGRVRVSPSESGGLG